MSSLSQEESRSISENVRWGIRKRMSDGKYSVNYTRFLGCDRGNDGSFVVNQEQAAIVRAIFRLCIMGYSNTAIASMLTDRGIATPIGNHRWYPETVREKILNESYKGDKLLQKTYTSDFLTKRVKKNNGELQQYYVTAGHEAILDPTLFDYVQELIQARKNSTHMFSGMHPLSNKIVCAECGNNYGLRPWHKTDLVWQCREKSKKGCRCKNTYIYDYALKIQLREVMMRAVSNKGVVNIRKEFVLGNVKDPLRRNAATKLLNAIQTLESQFLSDGENDYYLAIERISVYPDRHIEVKLIDGTLLKCNLRKYSPKRGWYDSAKEE